MGSGGAVPEQEADALIAAMEKGDPQGIKEAFTKAVDGLKPIRDEQERSADGAGGEAGIHNQEASAPLANHTKAQADPSELGA